MQPLLPSILTAADTAVLLAASPVVQAAQSEHGSSRASGGAGEAAAASIPQGWRCRLRSAVCGYSSVQLLRQIWHSMRQSPSFTQSSEIPGVSQYYQSWGAWY